ncbi:vWA domain-containing protein [Rhodovibrionaceae bacterium A322]
MSNARIYPLFDRAAYPVSHRLLGFARLLRRNGFALGNKETEDAGHLLSQLDLSKAAGLKAGLKTLFCSGPNDWLRFDELFDAYWLSKGLKQARSLVGQSATASPRKDPRKGQGQSGPAQLFDSQRGSGLSGSEAGEGQQAGASDVESLSSRDLRHLEDPAQLKAVDALAERLAARLRFRLGRREKRRRQGRRLDVRRVIHQSIATGGLPLRLAFRKRHPQPLKLVLLLDASGSMSLYSQFFLRFMSALLGQVHQAEAFVFHTRLVHVTPALREKNAERAIERMSLISQGWSGGTRIGDSLAAFNREHAKQVITRRTAVMILSDGYDTGKPELLAEEMARLGRRAKKIIWLNPMIGWRDYSPQAAGMAAALPHIDLFAPAHNLDSLAALEPYLARL